MTKNLLQIEGVRHGPRRVHANVRSLPIPGDTTWSGNPDRPGLRPRRERMRVQAQELHVGRRLVVLVVLGRALHTSLLNPSSVYQNLFNSKAEQLILLHMLIMILRFTDRTERILISLLNNIVNKTKKICCACF